MPKIPYNSDKKKIYITLLKKGFKRLHFNHALDREFLTFYNQRYKRGMTTSLLIAMIIFGASGIFDIFFAPHVAPLQIIRFLIVLPLVGILYLLLLTTKKFDSWIQYFLMASILIIAAGVILIGLLQPNPMRDMYFNGILLVLMFSFILSHLQFWNALITSVILYIFLLIGIHYDDTFTVYQLIAHSFIFIAAVVILGFSSYALEKSIRTNYLQHSLLLMEQKELKETKKHLEKLSSIDGLTGIANHRHFHDVLRISWNHSVRKNEELGLLIIDVDYFKQYNDLYGHQAGDRCLKAVANAITQSVRRSTDLTARYGGDEFVVLINDATDKSLNKIIDNIYHYIAKLHLKHEYSQHQIVTVSIGAAVTYPKQKVSPNDFIALADYALYQAKHQGRNRAVVINEDHTPHKS